MLPQDDCWSEDFDICCDQLYDLADDLRDRAFTAVQNCIDQTECLEPLRTYVSIGAPTDPKSDYVVAWVSNMLPNTFDTTDRFAFAGGTTSVAVNVRLLETGYPIPRTEGEGESMRIVVPDARQIRVAAQHSYAHGEAMFRAVANWILGRKCDSARFVSFGPTPRSGGSVGWEAHVALDQSFDR